MSKKKILAIVTALGIFIGATVIYLTDINKRKSVNIEFESDIKNLETHLEILLYNQKRYSYIFYRETLELPQFIKTFRDFQNSNEERKNILRVELFRILETQYSLMKKEGILLFQLISPDGKSILRMHKPDKFGDKIEYIPEHIEQKDKPIRIFSQGRTSHGFRNIYPIFDKGIYLGSIELSFSSESFQDYLMDITKLHTHFLIEKKIFDGARFKISDLIMNYNISDENSDYLLSISSNHENHILNNRSETLKDLNLEITEKMEKGEKFSVCAMESLRDIYTISFLPIKSLIKTENQAWFVSYKKSDSIYRTIKASIITLIIVMIILSVVLYLIYKKIISQQLVKKEHNLLNDILNSTNSVMFITNFQDVAFSNQKFKHLFHINNTQEFSEKIALNMINIFSKIDGYLHIGLVKENQHFNDLVLKSSDENRIVSIFGQAFHINITETTYNQSCDNNQPYWLVTLSDITKMKEREIEVLKKAYFDSLTEVFNRHKFNEIAIQELARDYRYKINLSIAIIDIDHFKNFNDTYGHQVGDEVLIMLAQYINSSIRDTDTFARWGGEEFVILFPETEREFAKNVCDKLRKGVENLNHSIAGNITASFGVTQYVENDTLATMLERCDNALYEAKKSGRNKVCVG